MSMNHHNTKVAFFGSRLLNTPFWAMFNMIPFILLKDLGASVLQITLLFTLKPAVSLFSMYWIGKINRRPDRLVKNIIGASLIGYLPFFFFPWAQSPWFFVFAFGLYMTMARGAIPAWMEILKRNMPGSSRTRIFAYATAVCYIGDALWPLFFCTLMDNYSGAWRWIFPITATIALLAIFLQLRISVPKEGVVESSGNWTDPWKNALDLIKKRPDFSRFQIGFMLGGSGLMILHPALPGFFMERLQLSYTELGLAITVCKGVGVVLASRFWARLIHKIDIYRFNSLVTLIAVIFPICLILSSYQMVWLYFGYILYGVMQAGSELSWNMSGPIFSRDEDSSVFTSVNILTQGIRGSVVPLIGGLMCSYFYPEAVMFAGMALCGLATVSMQWVSRNTEAVRLAE